MTTDERDKKLIAINAEIAEMEEELHGCDWCCGGGNERMDSLIRKRDRLKAIVPDDQPEQEVKDGEEESSGRA